MRLLNVKDVFTEAEMQQVIHLYVTCPPHLFAARCDTEIVAPVLHRINKETGQQNSSRYLAYWLQAILSQSR